MPGILLTCIGNRDPFSDERPQFFGAAMGAALTVKPDHIVVITTHGTRERSELTAKNILDRMPGSKIEFLHTELTNPSDFEAVDLKIRQLLSAKARDWNDIVVNLSSGTTQMILCLTALLATDVLQGSGIKISDPKFVEDPEITDIASAPGANPGILSEPIGSLQKRVQFIKHVKLPLAESVTRANSLVLCKRYDYSGARELLETSSRPKPYRKLVLPLIKIAEHLFLLQVENAREEFAKIHEPLLDRYKEHGSALAEAISVDKTVLFYVATRMRLEIGRIDDFIRCAGLTREICLNYYIRQESVLNHFRDALEQASDRSVLTMSRTRLEASNPALLDHLEHSRWQNQQRSAAEKSYGNGATTSQRVPLPETAELNSFRMMAALMYVAEHDPSIKQIVSILESTDDLRGLRNKFVHELRSPTPGDKNQARANFKKLEKILPLDGGYALQQSDPFKLTNIILTDLLKYWDES